MENERFEGNLERSGSSLQKTTVCSVILPHFPGQLGSARAKQAAKAPVTWQSCPLSGIFVLAFLEIRPFRLAVSPELRSPSTANWE